MRTLHVVSHTHWDREWYRTFQQFRLRLVHLIDGLLDLLEKDPHFKYFMLDGQTIVLDDYLLMRPEKESILRKHIQKGRIVIGPWHILPDMFLVGPEAHLRNLLQGDHTARKFGPKMMIGYIPDPFGHPGQIPQILRGFGIQTACVWRGLDEQPAEFWWTSPDGSRVLMAYLRDSYSNGAGLPTEDLPAFAEAISREGDRLAAHSAVSDYLIMLGTDHMEPPSNISQAIVYANKKLPDTRVIHSTLPHFVAALQDAIEKRRLQLPTVEGELRACRRSHLLPGVLSTRIWIKQRNHASETLLEKWAEPFSTFASLITTDDRPQTIVHRPSPIVQEAWRLLMECHPHDSICGCSIDQVHEEMKARFDQVDQIGEEISRQSLESLADCVTTDHGPRTVDSLPSTVNGQSAIVIFNPSSTSRTDVVNVALELPPHVSEFDLLDEGGSSLPYQHLGRSSQELVNMTLDPAGMQSTFGYISDGRAAGMTIQDMRIQRQGEQVFIEAILADGGEPNLLSWEAGRKQMNEYLAQPAITTYHVRARSTAATQIAFTAPDIPGLGYRTFWVRPRPIQTRPPMRLSPMFRLLLPLARLPLFQSLARRRKHTRPPYRIENEFFVVEARKDGRLDLLDKRDGQHYPGLNRFVDGGDRGDEYNYCPPEMDRLAVPRLVRLDLSRGSVQHTLTLELELKIPARLSTGRKSRSKEWVTIPITSTVTLAKGVPRLDIHTIVSNTAEDHRLRVHFPTPFAAEAAHYDGHFEVVERRIGIPDFDESWIEQPRPEVPQRAFTDVSDGRRGLMIANRGLPEIEVIRLPEISNLRESGKTEIALTLLRCIGWLSRDDFSTRKGHAGPSMETPGAQMPGKWEFDYSVIPHTGGWQNACREAYAFEAPLRAVSTDTHTGSLPTTGSFVEVGPATFVISAVKAAEDGGGWLVRGCNLTAEPVEVKLKPWRRFKKVEQVDLAEEKVRILKAAKDGQIVLTASGHEIVSLMLED